MAVYSAYKFKDGEQNYVSLFQAFVTALEVDVTSLETSALAQLVNPGDPFYLGYNLTNTNNYSMIFGTTIESISPASFAFGAQAETSGIGVRAGKILLQLRETTAAGTVLDLPFCDGVGSTNDLISVNANEYLSYRVTIHYDCPGLDRVGYYVIEGSVRHNGGATLNQDNGLVEKAVTNTQADPAVLVVNNQFKVQVRAPTTDTWDYTGVIDFIGIS